MIDERARRQIADLRAEILDLWTVLRKVERIQKFMD